jgi:hypothetical protein
MPLVPFNKLPPDARIWIFGSEKPLTGAVADTLLSEVDHYLEQWKAHGFPLRAAREWTEDRFLIVGIDPTAEQASGCSIDGLFRELQRVQTSIGARLLGGGDVFYRDASGSPRSVQREDFGRLVTEGEIGPDTAVFDTSLTRLDAWMSRFESPLAQSWAASLIN